MPGAGLVMKPPLVGGRIRRWLLSVARHGEIIFALCNLHDHKTFVSNWP